MIVGCVCAMWFKGEFEIYFFPYNHDSFSPTLLSKFSVLTSLFPPFLANSIMLGCLVWWQCRCCWEKSWFLISFSQIVEGCLCRTCIFFFSSTSLATYKPLGKFLELECVCVIVYIYFFLLLPFPNCQHKSLL